MATWSAQEEKYFKRIKKVFHSEYETGTLGIVECDDSAKREQVFEHITAYLPQLKHVRLDASQKQVKSLELFLKEHVSTKALKSQPITFMIHVTGLENSLYLLEGKRRVESTLLKQINIERETLWQLPFHIMIWGDHFLVRKMQQEAVDFWSWVTHYYRFEGEKAGVLPAAGIFQKPFLHQMDYKEFDQRILTYKEFLKDLEAQHKGRWTDQTLESKVNALLLLGDAYAVKGRFEQSVEKYKQADLEIANFKAPNPLLAWRVKKSLISGLLSNGSIDQAETLLDQVSKESTVGLVDDKWLQLQLLRVRCLNAIGKTTEAKDLFESIIDSASQNFLEISDETITSLFTTALESKLHKQLESIVNSLITQDIESNHLKQIVVSGKARSYSDAKNFTESLEILLSHWKSHKNSTSEAMRVSLELQILGNFISLNDTNSFKHWFEIFSSEWLESESEAYLVLSTVLLGASNLLDEDYFFEKFQIAIGFAVEYGYVDFLEQYFKTPVSNSLAKLPNEEAREFIETTIHLLNEAGGTEEAAELQAQLNARLKTLKAD